MEHECFLNQEKMRWFGPTLTFSVLVPSVPPLAL